MTHLGTTLTATASKSKSLVDPRAIGKPKELTGKEKDWAEWKLKATTWLRATYNESNLDTDKWPKWAEQQMGSIDDAAIGGACAAYNVKGWTLMRSRSLTGA